MCRYLFPVALIISDRDFFRKSVQILQDIHNIYCMCSRRFTCVYMVAHLYEKVFAFRKGVGRYFFYICFLFKVIINYVLVTTT